MRVAATQECRGVVVSQRGRMGPRAPDWTLLESLDPGELEEEDVEKVTTIWV